MRRRADGALEFVGRVDEQVKIRGHRVEPGEVEAVLLRHPAVAQAVVVGRSDGPSGTYLAAYVVLNDSGQSVVDGAALREQVAAQLPEHMVPGVVVVLGELPLSPSGKADRRALPAPEFTPDAPTSREPSNEVERTLVRLFSEVLHRDDVGVTDSFHALGGDSIVTIQLVARARKAGLRIRPRDVFEHRTAEALAAALPEADAAQTEAAPDDDPVGPVEPTPIVRSFAERGPLGDRHRMSVLLDVPALERGSLVRAVQAVLDTHDALRARSSAGTPGLEVRPRGAVQADSVVRVVAAPRGATPEEVEHEIESAAARLDPRSGVMVQVVWFDAGEQRPGRLLLVVHHSVVDGVSLRILTEDLATAWRAVDAGTDPALPAVGTSLRSWSRGLVRQAPARAHELSHWRSVLAEDSAPGERGVDPARDTWATVRTVTVELDDATTDAVLTTVPQAFFGAVDDVLLAGFGLAVAAWRRDRGEDARSPLVLVEGHGREESAVPGADLSRTVGWFTSQYPVRLGLADIDPDEALAGGPAAGTAVKRVKETLRSVPDHGIGYGMLRYLDPASSGELAAMPEPEFGFNYLGRMDTGSGDWSIAPGGVSAAYDPDMPVAVPLVVNAVTEVGPGGPRLTAHWMYAGNLLADAEVRDLARRWSEALDALVRHAAGPGAGGRTPSDLSLVSLDQAQLDALEAKWKKP